MTILLIGMIAIIYYHYFSKIYHEFYTNILDEYINKNESYDNLCKILHSETNKKWFVFTSLYHSHRDSYINWNDCNYFKLNSQSLNDIFEEQSVFF